MQAFAKSIRKARSGPLRSQMLTAEAKQENQPRTNGSLAQMLPEALSPHVCPGLRLQKKSASSPGPSEYSMMPRNPGLALRGGVKWMKKQRPAWVQL